MQTVIDIRMMAETDIPAVLEIQAVCYTAVTPESDESLHANSGLRSQPALLHRSRATRLAT